MSLEAVQRVTEAEQDARRRRAVGAEQAKRISADAERQGRERLAQARREAEARAKEMAAQAEKDAQTDIEAVEAEARRTCEGLRQAAEGRLEEAAALIIEKVVGDRYVHR